MTDLFKKLNVLIKSSLNDLLGDEGSARRTPISPQRLGKDIDRELTVLRQRVNEAIAYEDELKARVQTLEAEAARWDQQADEAISQGREEIGRHAVEQFQRAQQRATMAQSDLREHQLVTQELIQRVNTLEAAVADARRAQAETEAPSAAPTQAISDVLRNAREKITTLGEATGQQKVEEPTDRQAVDDDLEKRRQRLSKR